MAEQMTEDRVREIVREMIEDPESAEPRIALPLPEIPEPPTFVHRGDGVASRPAADEALFVPRPGEAILAPL